jgi:hypothetical protein
MRNRRPVVWEEHERKLTPYPIRRLRARRRALAARPDLGYYSLERHRRVVTVPCWSAMKGDGN